MTRRIQKCSAEQWTSLCGVSGGGRPRRQNSVGGAVLVCAAILARRASAADQLESFVGLCYINHSRMKSTGSGNTMVLFFSAPTSVNVWR